MEDHVFTEDAFTRQDLTFHFSLTRRIGASEDVSSGVCGVFGLNVVSCKTVNSQTGT